MSTFSQICTPISTNMNNRQQTLQTRDQIQSNTGTTNMVGICMHKWCPKIRNGAPKRAPNLPTPTQMHFQRVVEQFSKNHRSTIVIRMAWKASVSAPSLSPFSSLCGPLIRIEPLYLLSLLSPFSSLCVPLICIGSVSALFIVVLPSLSHILWSKLHLPGFPEA